MSVKKTAARLSAPTFRPRARAASASTGLLLLLALALPGTAQAAARFESVPVTTAFEGTQYVYEVLASGVGDVTVSAPGGLPGWLTLTRVANGEYLLTGTPRVGNTEVAVELVARDRDQSWLCRVFPQACMATQSFTIEIVGNRPPRVIGSGIPDQEATEGQSFSLDVSAHFEDPDGDPLSFAASGLPASLQLRGGVVAGEPAAADVSDSARSVTVTADDGRGGSVSDSFALWIRRLPRADLRLESITVSPAAALLDEPFDWELTVVNAGPHASGPLVLDIEWAGTPFTLSDHPCTEAAGDDGSPRLQCILDPLAAEDSATVGLRGSVSVAGDVVLTATVGSEQPLPLDPNPENNHAWRAVSVAEALAREPAQRLGGPAASGAASGALQGAEFDDLVLATEAGEPVLYHLNVDDPSALDEALKGPGDSRRGLSSLPLSAGEPGAHAAVLLVDLDNDGWPDVVVAGAQGEPPVIFMNDGDGALSAPRPLGDTGGAVRAIAAGDLNGNGYPDLVFANHGANRIYFNEGGTLGQGQPLAGSAGHDSRSVVVADLTGDGLADIVIANADGAALFYRNLGAGGFAAPAAVDPGPATSVAAGDFDGDGLPDLVFGRSAPGATGLAANPVYRNEGEGEFRLVSELGAVETLQVLAADFTGDGALDVLTLNAAGVHQLYVGDGGGGFTLHPRQLFSPGAAHAAAGRFGRDPSPGVAFAGADGTVVFFNDGSGNLGLGMIERPVIELIGPPEVAVTVGDPYEDPGVRAVDGAGRELEPVVDGSVDTAVVGSYVVSYTAMDRAGNAAEPVSRSIRVEARESASGGGGGAAGGALIGVLLLGLGLRLLHRTRPTMRRRPRRPAY